MRTLFLFALGASLLGAQTLKVTTLGLTNQQAIISITGDGSSCSIQAFEDAAHTKPVHDTDESLFPGSTNCARAGSIVSGNQATVVLGFRGTGTASDGKLYSRSLALETPYWVRVSLASGATQTLQVTTEDQQLGDSSPDYVPYSNNGFEGWGWPTIDYSRSDVTGAYIDPLRGRELVRLSAPGDVPYFQNANESFFPDDLSGGSWTLPNYQMPTGGTNTPYTYSGAGGANAALYLRFSWVPHPSGSYGYDIVTAIDDVLLNLQGYGDPVNACLTFDHGQTCTGNTITLTWPSGASASAPGSVASSNTFPSPILDAWGSPDVTAPMLQTEQGTVSINGSVVTVTGGNPFPLEALKPGSVLQFYDSSNYSNYTSEYTIASIQSGNQVTLTQPPSNPPPNPGYQINDVGIKVWKVPGGSGSVAIASGNYSVNASHNFGTEAQGQGATGCGGALTITQDQYGNTLTPAVTGYICTLVDSQGDQIQKIWTPSNGQVWQIHLSAGSNVANPNANPDYYSYANNEIQKCYYDLPNSTANCLALQTAPSISSEIASAHPEIDTTYYGGWEYRGGSYPYFVFSAQRQQNAAYWTCTINASQTPGAAQVQDCHNSWSTYPLRWETSHSQGADYPNGNYLTAFQNFGMTQPSEQAGGEYTLSIVHVYSNGLSGTLQSDTSLSSNAYDPNSCAALGVTNTQWLAEASNGPNSCVVIDVSGEPVNTSPPSSDLSPYGSVPVGSKPTASPVDPAYSYLQPMQEGDWIGDSYNTGQSERFVIAKKTVLQSGLIQLVLVRNPNAFGQSNGTQYHGAGWVAFMAPPLLPGNSCGGVYYSRLGQTFSTANWIQDNPSIWCGHQATWQTSGKEIHVGVQAGYAGNGTLPDALGGYFSGYGIRYGTIPGVWGNNGLQYAQQAQYPFAGGFNQVTTDFQQTHPGGDTWGAPSREQVWALDGRPYGPAGGSGYGLQLWQQTLTGVSGQSATYKISLPGGANVLYENSASGPKWTANLDLKRRGIHAWSGFHLLRSISRPGSQINDATPWTYCIASNAGECVSGSSVGDAFISVPGANTAGYCWEGDGSINAPCLTVAGPEMGGYEQFDIDHWDPFGLAWRNLTMGFDGPGRTGDFANMHGKSTGDYGLTAVEWGDGRRSDVFAAKLGDWPNSDVVNRTQFESVKVSFVPKVTEQVYGKFGYSEYSNGSGDPFFCSPNRMEECSTAPVNADPYAFVSEPQAPQTCTAGNVCTITLKVASQRVVNFAVQASTDGGKTFVSGPTQMMVTP